MNLHNEKPKTGFFVYARKADPEDEDDKSWIHLRYMGFGYKENFCESLSVKDAKALSEMLLKCVREIENTEAPSPAT